MYPFLPNTELAVEVLCSSKQILNDCYDLQIKKKK